MVKKVKINMFWLGFDVKVCIDIIMFEWIIKVFSKFNENVVIVSNMV